MGIYEDYLNNYYKCRWYKCKELAKEVVRNLEKEPLDKSIKEYLKRVYDNPEQYLEELSIWCNIFRKK